MAFITLSGCDTLDDIIGKKLSDGNIVILEYIITNKADSNGKLKDQSKKYMNAIVKKKVEILKSTDKGDILVFMCGKGEVSTACFMMKKLLGSLAKKSLFKEFWESNRTS